MAIGAEERDLATTAGWPVETVPGGHLHPLVDPPAVGAAVERGLAALGVSDRGDRLLAQVVEARADGVDPEQLAAHFGSMLQNPTSDHERYLRDYVIPKVHGIDTAAPPPPPARKVAEITT